MLDKQEELTIGQVRELIGEHFHNFAFCVISEDGEIFYDYQNRVVGKALLVGALEEMDSSIGIDFDWEEEEDDDDEGEKWKSEIVE
tara:strand:+ start:243 stop:500 length:258 start_codon:yes stop_codon:yes gene_type:complete